MNRWLKSFFLISVLVLILVPFLPISDSIYYAVAEGLPYPPPYPPPSAPEQAPTETFPYPPPTTSEDTPSIETGVVARFDKALSEDAAVYASIYEVSLDEAVQRLKLQDDIGELNSRLSEMERATFAGLWIQHQPDYRVIIQFTRTGNDTLQPYLVDNPLTDMIELRTAAFNLDELEKSRSQAAQLMRDLGIPANSAINIRKNRVEVYVLDPAQVSALLQSRGWQLPLNTHLSKMKNLGKEVDDIYGGLSLTTCTSGFSVAGYSVTDDAVVKGITTAGHCDNTQSYNGTQLPWLGGTPDKGGDYDIQWHKGEHAFHVMNRIAHDGNNTRLILGVKFRSEQTLGSFVCKNGRATGYACGTIAEVGVNGINIRVNIEVDYGDSGGPWFLGNTAYGTTIYLCKLGNGDPCAIYGPVDQIYEVLGLTILTGDIYLPLIMK